MVADENDSRSRLLHAFPQLALRALQNRLAGLPSAARRRPRPVAFVVGPVLCAIENKKRRLSVVYTVYIDHGAVRPLFGDGLAVVSCFHFHLHVRTRRPPARGTSHNTFMTKAIVMATATTNFTTTEPRVPSRPPQPARSASSSGRPESSSPMSAPRNGPRRSPTGRKKSPATAPSTAPNVPAWPAPNRFAPHARVT